VTQALWFLRKSRIALLGDERASDGSERQRVPGDPRRVPIYDV